MWLGASGEGDDASNGVRRTTAADASSTIAMDQKTAAIPSTPAASPTPAGITSWPIRLPVSRTPSAVARRDWGARDATHAIVIG